MRKNRREEKESRGRKEIGEMTGQKRLRAENVIEVE